MIIIKCFILIFKAEMYTLTSILVLSSRKRVQFITHTRTWIEKIIFLATDSQTCFSLRISSMTRVVD
jgi:hypothetical protein